MFVATPDKPHVFSVRISGSDLSWGRGKTRDAAIDAAIRAAFVLVAAHGYNEFDVDEDCMTTEPVHVLIAPPPPPPPPITTIPFLGPPPSYTTFTNSSAVPLPPLPGGPPPLPPFPMGLMPPPFTGGQEDAHLIPQPKLPPTAGPETTQMNTTQGFSLGAQPGMELKSSKSKTGSTLVFDGDVQNEGDDYMFISMEEKRSLSQRYRAMVHRAVVNRLAIAPTK